MKPKSAFTLIEVLIVVLIFGILATLVIPQFEGMIIRAKLAEIFPIVNAIARAEELYYLEYGEYAKIVSNWSETNIEEFENKLGITLPENSNCVYYAYAWGVPPDPHGVTICVARRPSTGGEGGLCHYFMFKNPDTRGWDYWGRPGANPTTYDEWCLYLSLPGVPRMTEIPC